MSYTPDESPAQLYAEKTWLAGSIMTGAGYGVVLALFWLCLRSLWHRTRVKDADYTRNCFFIVYVCVMFALGSFFMGSIFKFTQLAFVDDRNFPGGPSAWEVEMFSINVDEISNVSFVLADWCSAALMVWRCVIIYRDCGTCPWPIVMILGSMLLASFGLGILFLLQISSPLSSPYYAAGTNVNYTLPYVFLELVINIIVTILIVLRLYIYRQRMAQASLGSAHVAEHTNVASMIVESAAIYSIFSLLFLIPFATKSPVANVFLQVLGEVQLIAPLLIIYREAQGNGWISSASSASSSSKSAIRSREHSDIQFTSQHMYNEGLTSTDQRDMFTITEEGRNIDNGDDIIEIPRMHKDASVLPEEL
ncbi:uncharacterized protein EDB91DRAFT_784285 [Suillus paluster]|uniref:uncharacterized protein n=1 Tax=Suillus paluster TaxID=48578 RepID=UPI001B87C206|nr:uncharacterized protein EDB91DRAFT_784285 [Suillus paluster]KAG1730559.1 hypothetical protein EDB91DRAFT_784285 [Suillus paluster]